jgi:hypothetical protein
VSVAKKRFLLAIGALALLAVAYVILTNVLAERNARGKWISTKGGEVGDIRQWNKYQNPINELNLAWARIPLEWSKIETEEGAYRWDSDEYINVKNALTTVKKMGAEAILTIRDAPDFSIDPSYGVSPDGASTPWPALCGRITPQGMDHLASFIVALLGQLKQDYGLNVDAPPPITYIELWNEPDVDPTQTIRPDLYGCWQRGIGNAADPAVTGTPPPYDAGYYYARVLNTVAPAVKGRFPEVKFVAGAAISANSGFLSGVIDQALENIDVVSYHQYVKSPNTLCDIPALLAVQENSFAYVRDYLDQHGGSSRPILISEGAMRYTTYGMTPLPGGTQTPAPEFYNCQARFASDLLSWSQDKAAKGKLLGFIWYTIAVNGWEETDLLAPNKTPKPVYYSWKN